MDISAEELSLETWLKSEQIFHTLLYRSLVNQQIYSLDQLRNVPPPQFESLLQKAKNNGLLADKADKLHSLYLGVPISSLPHSSSSHRQRKLPHQRSRPTTRHTTDSIATTDSDASTLRSEVRAQLQPWMQENGIWTLSLFDVFIQKGIHTPDALIEMDDDAFEDLVVDARRNGLIAKKLKILQSIYHGEEIRDVVSSAPSSPGGNNKRRRKNSARRAASGRPSRSPRSIKKRNQLGGSGKRSKSSSSFRKGRGQDENDDDDEKTPERRRQLMRPWMESQGIWQPSLGDVFLRYGITYEEDLSALSSEDFDGLFADARLAGLIAKRRDKLFEMYHGHPPVKKRGSSRRRVGGSTSVSPNVSADEVDEEKEARLRQADLELKPWLREREVYQKDFFELLVQRDVCTPTEFSAMSRSEFETVFTNAKRKGLMGQKPEKLRNLFERLKTGE